MVAVNADAGVGHFDADQRGFGLAAYFDLAAVGGVLDRVVDEIIEDFANGLFVGVDL